MNDAIKAFLKEATEKVSFSKGRIDVVVKSGKDTISFGMEGKDRYLKVLKEVVKYL